MTEDKMVGWHHQLHKHEFEQTLGDSEGQGRLACCSPWGCKELDTAQETVDWHPPSRPSAVPQELVGPMWSWS